MKTDDIPHEIQLTAIQLLIYCQSYINNKMLQNTEKIRELKTE